MAYTKNPTWVDGEGGGTRIDAADLQNIEDGLFAAAATADGAIPKTLVDAKGDLLAGTGADTITRLALGASGASLVADSTQATGLRWTTALRLEGSGIPEGAVSAPIGSTYTDSAATTGAVLWIKTSGTGNTGWKVSVGDTGIRDVASLLVNGWTVAGVDGAKLYRVGSQVVLILDGLTASAMTSTTLMTIPAGFRPVTMSGRGLMYSAPAGASATYRILIGTDGVVTCNGHTTATPTTFGRISWDSSTWPTALP